MNTTELGTTASDHLDFESGVRRLATGDALDLNFALLKRAAFHLEAREYKKARVSLEKTDVIFAVLKERKDEIGN